VRVGILPIRCRRCRSFLVHNLSCIDVTNPRAVSMTDCDSSKGKILKGI
jgi:hypothetical protein